jgi:hypothetical protein
MKRYVYFLIIGLSFILLYNVFSQKEGLTNNNDSVTIEFEPDDILKVELISKKTAEELEREKEAAATAKASAQASAAAARAAAQAAGSNNVPDTIPPMTQSECKADKASIGSNTSTLAQLPAQLASAQSKLAAIQSKIDSNTEQIQDASGILTQFVKKQVVEGKQTTGCADAIDDMGKPKYKVSSDLWSAVTQLFSGFEKTG